MWRRQVGVACDGARGRAVRKLRSTIGVNGRARMVRYLTVPTGVDGAGWAAPTSLNAALERAAHAAASAPGERGSLGHASRGVGGADATEVHRSEARGITFLFAEPADGDGVADAHVVDVGEAGARRLGPVKRLTYPSLHARALAVGGALRAAGVKPGDVVLLQVAELSRTVEALWGCFAVGALPAPTLAPSADALRGGDVATVTRLRQAWETLGNPVVLVEEATRDAVVSSLHGESGGPARVLSLEELVAAGSEPLRRMVDVRETDRALVMLTSGTTSAPKAVPLSHKNCLASIDAQAWAFSPSALANPRAGRDMNVGYSADGSMVQPALEELSSHVSLNCFPLYHAGGLLMFHLRDVAFGCDAVLLPGARFFEDPARWVDAVSHHRATLSWGPNYFFALIAEATQALKAEAAGSGDATEAARARLRSWDLASLQYICNAGECIVARTANQFIETMAEFGLRRDRMFPGWGMAETASLFTLGRWQVGEPDTSDDVRFVPVGRPLAGGKVRIVDDDGKVVPANTVGDLQVSGRAVVDGFHNNEEATADWCRDSEGAGEWRWTGDHGFVDETGQLTITGRDRNLLLLNGVFYYCVEVEVAMSDVAGVRPGAAAAFSVRSDGDRVYKKESLVVLYTSVVRDDPHGGPNSDAALDLARDVRATVAQTIGVVTAFALDVPVEAIPRTSIGKVQHALLRFDFEAGALREAISAREAAGRVRALRNDAETRAQDAATVASLSPAAAELLPVVSEVWSEALKVQLRPGADVFEAGATPAIVDEVVKSLEDRLDRPVIGSLFAIYPTLVAMADALADL